MIPLQIPYQQNLGLRYTFFNAEFQKHHPSFFHSSIVHFL